MNNPPEHVAAFVKSLTNEMLAFCGPIFITPGLNTYPDQMIDNGTYSLIDTGQKRLLVTCRHVWQAYLDEHVRNPEAALCLKLGEDKANIAFKCPEKQIIDSDPDLDLAVFEFEPDHLYAGGNKINHKKDWFPIRTWPIQEVTEGDHVTLMGFSGKEIKKDGQFCTFGTCALPFRVSGVGQKEIWIFNDSANQEVFGYVRQRLGGLSGSPAYTLDKHGANLVGFVKSGYKSGATEEAKRDSIFAGTLILAPASYLEPDGSLRQL
jgi:hypothetical protein